MNAWPQGDVPCGGPGCDPPVVTGIQVLPPPGGADHDPHCHSSHMGAGVRRATSPEHPAAPPCAGPPARTSISEKPDGLQTRELEETGGTPAQPHSRRETGEGRRAAALTPEGRPAGRCGAEDRAVPDSPASRSWSVSGTVIKNYIFRVFRIFYGCVRGSLPPWRTLPPRVMADRTGGASSRS